MKKFLAIALAAMTMTAAAPAMAQTFTGLRAEGTIGVDDVSRIGKIRSTSDVTYGAALGLDAPVANGNLVVGVEASVDNLFDRRDIAGSVRLGVPMGRVMPYAKVGYADFRGLEGVRYGGGLEYALTDNLYTGAEYRYSDLERGVGRHQGLVKLGVRF